MQSYSRQFAYSFIVFAAGIGGFVRAEAPTGFQLEGENWTYVGEGLPLRGILLKPEGKGPFPAVLISHGLGGSTQSFGRAKARELVKWGMVCIACDYTHAGGSGANRPDMNSEARKTFGASEENLRRASKCLDIVASLPEVDPKKLFAYGHSMGGFVTIGLAAKEPDRLKAAAISGSGVAPSVGFAAPSVDSAKSVRTPFIIFHGADDTTVRPAQSLSFKEVLDSNHVLNERHLFEGVGHPVDQQRPDEVYTKMRAWFAKFGLQADNASSESPPSNRTEVSLSERRTRPTPSTTSAPEWVREKIEAKNSLYETFHSATIDQPVSYFIYLPAEYSKQPDRRFPVMYWLHGIGGAQSGVPRLVERFDDAMAAGKMPSMLIVFVNGVRDSFYCDDADGKIPVETVIIKDLIPYIDSKFRTNARREERIIEGFSMGGFGAAHLGFKYPDLFGAVSILDGALLDIGTMESRHNALYKRIFAEDPKRFDAAHPNNLATKNAEQIRGKTLIRVAVGALAGGNQSLNRQLQSLNIEHEYRELNVGHNHMAVYEKLGEDNWTFYANAVKQSP